MAVIPFKEYLPDQAELGNPGVVAATNTFPSASGYRPVQALTPVTDALDARPRGAIQARDSDGNVFQFAGDASKLYQNSGGAWSDFSKGGGYSTGDGEIWEFVAWKNKVLGVNYSDDPQQITFGASNFSDLTTDLRARHIAVIRDFVVMANTFDSSDGAVPSRTRWCAYNQETDWTVDPATFASFYDLKTAEISRIFGGEFGVILQPNSVWRQTFVGNPGGPVFQFDEVLPGIGLIAPGAAVRDGDVVYFLSTNGFYALENGTQATPIGANKVDNTVLKDLDPAYLHRISSAVESTGQRIFFAYPGQGNTGGRPNKIAVYDRPLNRWSGPIEEDVELLWRSGETGLSLEDLDNISGSIDALPASLDSKRWIGGAANLAAFDGDFKSGFFDGDNMTATIRSKELEINRGRNTHLNGFRALVNGGATTVRVGTRDRQKDSIVFGPSLSERASGMFRCRENARYHSFELTISGDWEYAIGLQIEPEDAKRGERRA